MRSFGGAALPFGFERLARSHPAAVSAEQIASELSPPWHRYRSIEEMHIAEGLAPRGGEVKSDRRGCAGMCVDSCYCAAATKGSAPRPESMSPASRTMPAVEPEVRLIVSGSPSPVRSEPS